MSPPTYMAMHRAVMKWVRHQLRRLIRPIILKEPNLPVMFNAYQADRDDFLIAKGERDSTGEPAVPPRELWVATGPGGYGDSDEEYLRIGRQHVENMLALLDSSGVTLRPESRLLDLGCASGRLIRWFADQAETGEVWGVDIDAEQIVWCQQNLSPPFHFCTTTTIPHLPFEDHYFNFAYAGSVFTHIGELADAWLLELRRVLDSNGFLYLTINDKQSMKVIRGNPDFNLAKKIASANARIPIDKVDFEMVSISRSYTLHDRECLERKLGRWFEVVAIESEAYGFQTGILLRKR